MCFEDLVLDYYLVNQSVNRRSGNMGLLNYLVVNKLWNFFSLVLKFCTGQETYPVNWGEIYKLSY